MHFWVILAGLTCAVNAVSIGYTNPFTNHDIPSQMMGRNRPQRLPHSRLHKLRTNRLRTALNDDNINSSNDELNVDHHHHAMHEITNVNNNNNINNDINARSFYKGIDDISRQFAKFSWHINPTDSIMFFDGFVSDREHLHSASEYLQKQVKFIACPADYDLHRYEIDSHYLQTTRYYSTCNRLTDPQIDISSTDTPVPYNSKGELGYRIRVGFNGTLDLRSPFLKAHLAYNTPLRWTIIALLPSATNNIIINDDGEVTKQNPIIAMKQFMLLSPTVRFFKDAQSENILLQNIHMDLWEYIRLSERPQPQTAQEAIDILRPLSYDIEGTWRRYADLDDLFKNCSAGYVVGYCDRWRVSLARERIQEAMNVLERFFRLRYSP